MPENPVVDMDTAIYNIGYIIMLVMKHTSPELTESVQYSCCAIR
jgi:hypothetical protein